MQQVLLVEYKLMIHLSRSKQICLEAECSLLMVPHKLHHAMPKRTYSRCANCDIVAVHGVTSQISPTLGSLVQYLASHCIDAERRSLLLSFFISVTVGMCSVGS